jgi:putative acetyltransferase
VIAPGEPAFAELKRMWVAPGARGGGLGARLLAHLETIAREHGVRVLRLETGPLQHAAIRMYRRAGYRERGPFGDYALDPLSIFMERPL